MIKRKGVTKGDFVRSIKDLWNIVNHLNNKILGLENILVDYMDYKKDEKKFNKYLDKKNKSEPELPKHK